MTMAGRQLADVATALWWQPNKLAGPNAMQSATSDVRDAILDIEREAIGLERARILAAVERLRRQVVRSPELGGDAIDAELGQLINEVFLIVDAGWADR